MGAGSSRTATATATHHTVYVLAFERDPEQPIAGAIASEPDAELVITEGNYLLSEQTPWHQFTGVLAESWFDHLDDDAVRGERLIARHIAFGKGSRRGRHMGPRRRRTQRAGDHRAPARIRPSRRDGATAEDH